MLRQFVMITAGLVVAQSGLAAEVTVPPEWKGEAELGLVYTSGNTETDTVNLKAKIAREEVKWRHSASVAGLRTSDNNGTTAQRVEVKGQSDYKFSKHEYLFGLVNYENDRFSGYSYRISESVGYGRRVVDRSGMTLDLEVGPGARQSKLDDGSRENEFVVRGAAKYTWSISETSKFTEDFSIESGKQNTVSKSVTALSSRINGNLAMRLSYTVKYTSSVPPAIKNTDTETAVTLVYSY